MAKAKAGSRKTHKTGSGAHKQALSEGTAAYVTANKNVPKAAMKAIGKEKPEIKTAAMIVPGIHGKRQTPPTSIERMHLVRKGVTKKYLIRVKKQTNLDYQKLADVLSVTRATLINKKDEDKFNVSLSERIVGLAALYDYGYEVFEDKEKFKAWMFTPNRALGGEMPYDLIDNQFGREEVKNVLGRIEYGVYS